MDIQLTVDNLEEALNHALVRGLLESMSDGAIVIDAHTRKILVMNQRARSLLQYRDGQALGCQCKKMMNSPACSSACPLTALLEGRPEDGSLSLFYRGKDGKAMLHAQTRMLLVRGRQGQPLAGIELFADMREVTHLRRQIGRRQGLLGMVGQASVMQQVYRTVEQVAPYPVPVLITGESGVGKERVADAIHYHSDRSDKPFMKLNCAALSPTLVESELFGHVSGAYTGASKDRRGIFEKADGGTLFLDEVGELEAPIQAKLLRVLQQGEIIRLGDERVRKVDVRIIAATNRNLEEQVGNGSFRQDLFFRLHGVGILVPPLRSRLEDLPLLTAHFIQRFQQELARPGKPVVAFQLHPTSLPFLMKRDWPGNVRELENALRLAAIRALPHGEIQPQHFDESTHFSTPAEQKRVKTLTELEADAIEQAMKACKGNHTKAAKMLGIDRTTLWRKLKT